MESIISQDSDNKKGRKQYQAEITALKKQAKSNKKNKKELLLEIARLENELTNLCTQNNSEESAVEIAASTESNEIDNGDNCQNESQNQRSSKAKKRRDKKANQEREREQRIKDQEVENKLGPRNKEISAINDLLKTRALMLFLIPSDGDCLYKAIEHQLSIQSFTVFDVSALRLKTATFLRDNVNEFLPFMTNPDTGDLLTEREFNEYCELVINTKAWGGQVELKAISSALKVTIEVLQAAGPPTIQGQEYNTKPLVLTYHRHMFGLGEHYNSTRPRTSEDSGEESNTE